MANRDFFRRLGLADEVAAPTLSSTSLTRSQAKIVRPAFPI